MELSDDKLIELFEQVTETSLKVAEVYNRLIGDGNKKGEIDKLNEVDAAILKELVDIRKAVRDLQDALGVETRNREAGDVAIGRSLYDHDITVTVEEKTKKKTMAKVWGILSLAGAGVYKLIELAIELWSSKHKS